MPKAKQKTSSRRGAPASATTSSRSASRRPTRPRRQNVDTSELPAGLDPGPTAIDTEPVNPGELSWPIIPSNINIEHDMGVPPPSFPLLSADTTPSAAAHVDTALCGVGGEAGGRYTPAMSCVCDELGADVAGNTKEKIWQGEYVELGMLVRKDAGRGDDSPTFSLAPTGGSLLLRPQNKIPQIEEIEKWTSAFMIYASILLERHPTRARELLKYMDIIRSITRFGGFNWRSYDVQFRLRQARQPHRSWAVIDTELWLTVAAVSPTAATSLDYMQPFRANYERPAARGARGPAGPRYPGTHANSYRGDKTALHCFAFNGGGCTRFSCQYPHKCARCGAISHGASTCKLDASKRAGGNGTN